MKSLVYLFVVVFLASNIPSSAFGEDVQTSKSFLVLGVASLPEFEGADRSRLVPLAVSRITALGTDIEIEGLEARVDILPHPSWRAGPAFGVILPRNESFVEDPEVAQLQEIDAALELGAYVGFLTPFGSLPEGKLSGAVTARHDVLGAHNGLTVETEIEFFFAATRMLRFGVGANASFATEDYFDTYFSLDESSAAIAGAPSFKASGGARDVGVEVFSILSFSPHGGIFSRVAYNRLLSDAADSPIIEKFGSPDQVFAGAGIFWAFGADSRRE